MRDQLTLYISEELLGGRGDVALSAEDDLLTTGLIDSLGVISLVFFIEERFGVSVPPEDVTIDHFGSVAAIEAYIRGRVA